MAHARPFWASTLQDLFIDIKNAPRRGDFPPQIVFWIFGSPGGLHFPTFGSVSCILTQPQSGVATNYNNGSNQCNCNNIIFIFFYGNTITFNQSKSFCILGLKKESNGHTLYLCFKWYHIVHNWPRWPSHLLECTSKYLQKQEYGQNIVIIEQVIHFQNGRKKDDCWFCA